jgi:hypothetical protein
MVKPGKTQLLAPPPPPPQIYKNLQKTLQKKKKKGEALQYCDSNEFIEITVGTSRVLMSKAATQYLQQ